MTSLCLSSCWGFFITINLLTANTFMPDAQDFLRTKVHGLLRQFEGFEPAAYQVSGEDFYTIGYGNTQNPDGSPIRAGQTVTRDEADRMMRDKTDAIYNHLVQDEDFASLSDGARSALTSFSYNTGENWIGAPGFETMTKHLRNRDEAGLRDAMMLYTNPGTSVHEGLVRRRKAEQPLFDLGSDGKYLQETPLRRSGRSGSSTSPLRTGGRSGG